MEKPRRYLVGAVGVVLVAVLLTAFVLSGCMHTQVIGESVDGNRLVDGVYQGSFRGGPNKAVVRVTIKEKKIVEVELVSHFASWKGKRANSVIPKRIVEKQSTNVDAVTGATNSSRVIMNAVQKAIEKSYAKKGTDN